MHLYNHYPNAAAVNVIRTDGRSLAAKTAAAAAAEWGNPAVSALASGRPEIAMSIPAIRSGANVPSLLPEAAWAASDEGKASGFGPGIAVTGYKQRLVPISSGYQVQ